MFKYKKTTSVTMIVLGVTLIEVLLVLAVVAVILVVAIRYYQTVVNNEYANSAMEMLTNITAEASNLQTASGSFSAISTSAIQPLMPNNSLGTQWGGNMSIVGAWKNGYMISINNIPLAVCLLIESHLASNPSFSNDSGEDACAQSSGNTLYYIYSSS